MAEESTAVELKGVRLAWRKFICRHRGHRFDEREYKRFCRCCGREEWVFSNPYPRIGEPKYEWCYMNFGTRFVPAGRPALTQPEAHDHG